MAAFRHPQTWTLPLLVAVLIVGSLVFHSVKGGGATATSACPPLRPGTSDAAADYTDLFIWGARRYVASHTSATGMRIGKQVTTVRCSIADLTRTNHELVGPLPWPDRTATFLPTGTPMFAVEGSEPTCELVAVPPTGVKVYVREPADGC